MTNQPAPEETRDQDPLIPPGFLLILAAVGLIVALIVALTQPTFDIIGWGGLALAVVALFGWVLSAPDRARSVFSSRWLRYGGLAVVVLLLVSIALIGLYTVARNQNWRTDLTQSNAYSLSDTSAQAISAYSTDPSLPPVQMLAFYPASQASQQDRDSALLDSYVQASNGKITYTFVDPDREPQKATQYGVQSYGQIAVMAQNADGTLDSENAVLVSRADQEQLTNAVLRVAASGTFVAHILNVRDGVAAADMSLFTDTLTNRFDWKVDTVSLAELTAPQAEYPLNDPNVDGELLILPGGSAPLAPEELEIVRNYLEQGGDLMVLAGTNLNQDGVSLATDPAFNQMLNDLYGVQFNNDVVIDPSQAFQSPLIPVATDLSSSAFVTSNGIPSGQAALIFETPPSIAIAGSAPAGVTTSVLARSSDQSYATTDLQRVLGGDVARTDSDAAGPMVLAAQAEDRNTGSKLVLFSSPSLLLDTYTMFSNVDNFQVSVNGAVWATNFNNFVAQVTVPQEQRPTDVPIYADTQSLRTISFVTLYLLPFGILLLGVGVWWVGRSRRRALAQEGR
ncbi:MAG: GldG family protein [Anaerolineae bacterium]